MLEKYDRELKTLSLLRPMKWVFLKESLLSYFTTRLELAIKNSFQKHFAIAITFSLKSFFYQYRAVKTSGVSNCCNFLNFVITRQTNDIDWCKFANFTKRFWQGHSAEPNCGRNFNIMSRNYVPFII